MGQVLEFLLSNWTDYCEVQSPRGASSPSNPRAFFSSWKAKESVSTGFRARLLYKYAPFALRSVRLESMVISPNLWNVLGWIPIGRDSPAKLLNDWVNFENFHTKWRRCISFFHNRSRQSDLIQLISRSCGQSYAHFDDFEFSLLFPSANIQFLCRAIRIDLTTNLSRQTTNKLIKCTTPSQE